MNAKLPRSLASWVVFFLFWAVFLGIGRWARVGSGDALNRSDQAAFWAWIASVVGFAVTGVALLWRYTLGRHRRSPGQ
jgi:hypothetical protein